MKEQRTFWWSIITDSWLLLKADPFDCRGYSSLRKSHIPVPSYDSFTLQSPGVYCTHSEQGCRHHISRAVDHDLQATIVLSPNNWPNSSLSQWSSSWDEKQQWLGILLISAPPTSRGGASPYHSAVMSSSFHQSNHDCSKDKESQNINK